MTPRSLLAPVLLALSLGASALADPPRVGSAKPMGLRRGATNDLALSGSNLDNNPRLLAPFGFAIEPNPEAKSDAATWRVRLRVADDAPLGIYPVRVATDDGVSAPFLLAVGQAPSVAEAEANDAPEIAQSMPAPCYVEGTLPGNDVDFIRFPGKKGQRIVVDAQCARIGSTVDPQIRLTTASRVFVESADDTLGLGPDARLVATLPEDGDYLVEISDSKYTGGNKPQYRLLIGAVTVAEEVYPLGGRRGETVGFELRGGTVEGLRTLAATLNASPSLNQLHLPSDVEFPYPIALSPFPELREPADASAPPTKGAAPVVFNGRIDPAGDEDRFALAVTPGQKLRIQVEASELGSALDGTLQVLGPKGNVLATAEDTVIPANAPKGQKKAPGAVIPDPALEFTVPGDANEITLALRDLVGRGGIGFGYRIVVEPSRPDFEVVLNDGEISIPKGGHAAIPVTIRRRGYNGPITLGIADPPAGLNVQPGTITDGQSVGVFTVSANADASFNPAELTVTGTGTMPDGPLVEPALKELILAQQGNIPVNTLTFHRLGAALAKTRPVVFEAPPAPIEVVHGYGAPIPIKLKRAEKDGEGALTLSPLPLPTGLTLPNAKIDAKAAEGSATVNAAPEAPLATFTIGLTAKGSVGGKDQTLAVPALSVTIVRPAALALTTPAVEIKPGGSVEIKGKVDRKPVFKVPVQVKINGLPDTLKAEPVTVAPDASEFTLKLTATDKAAVKTENVNVSMSFPIANKPYGTPPVSLAIKVVK